MGAHRIHPVDDFLPKRAGDLQVAVFARGDGHATRCRARMLPSPSADTYRVPSAPAAMPANGPCGPENGGMPLSGFGTTPDGGPTGSADAIVRRTRVVRSCSTTSLAPASTI